MAQDSPCHQRFVARVHQRMLALRLLEAAAIGLLSAALVAPLPLLLLMWRGESGLQIAFILLPLGALCGLLWAVVRRPTPLNAAQEADRQLNLADLLTTAAMTPPHGDFAGAVHAMASARCSMFHPRQVILARLGLRTWGGVGLATALTLTLALMSANPLESHALALRQDAGSSGTLPPQVVQDRAAEPRSSQLPSHMTGDHRNDGDERGIDDANATASSRNATGQQGTDQHATQANGTTGGAGRSTDTALNDPPTLRATATQNPTGAGEPAGGTGAGADNAAPGSAAASPNTAGPSTTPPAPPWTSPNWDQSRQAAESAVRSGQVPPAYQDLVRAYFAR